MDRTRQNKRAGDLNSMTFVCLTHFLLVSFAVDIVYGSSVSTKTNHSPDSSSIGVVSRSRSQTATASPVMSLTPASTGSGSSTTSVVNVANYSSAGSSMVSGVTINDSVTAVSATRTSIHVRATSSLSTSAGQGMSPSFPTSLVLMYDQTTRIVTSFSINRSAPNSSSIYVKLSGVLSKASTNSTNSGTLNFHSPSSYIPPSTAGNATVTRLPAISPTISHITDSLEYTQTSATPSLTSNTSVTTMLTSSSMYTQTSNYLPPSSQSGEPENIMLSSSLTKGTFSPSSSSVSMNSSMYTETSTYTLGLVSFSSRQRENATSSSINTSGTSSVPLSVTSNSSMTVSFTTSITSGTVSNTTSSIIDSSGTSSVPPVQTSKISTTASHSINVTNETVSTSFAAVLLSSSVKTRTSTYIVGLVSSSSAQRENISYIYASSEVLSKASTNSTRIGTVKIHSRSTYITLSTAGNATVTRLPAISPTISHITDSLEYTQTSATPSLTSNTSVATMLTSSSMYSQTSNYLRPSSQSREPENIMSSRSVRKETFSPFSSSVAMNSSMYTETSTYTSGLVSSSSRQPENATSSSIDTSGTSSVPLTVTSNRSMTVSFTSSITSGTVSNTTSSIIDSSGTSSVPPVWTSKISRTASFSINVTNETVSSSFAAVLMSSSVNTSTSTYIVGLVSSSSAQRENISYIYTSSDFLSKASTNSTRIGTVKIHSRSTYITLSTAGNATVTRLPAISPTISHITDSLEYTQTSATPSLTSNTSVATMLTSSSMYSQTSNYLRPSSQSREPENIMSSRSVRKETFSPFSSSVAMNSSMYTETSTYTSGLVSSSSRQPENATSSSIDTSGTSSVPLTVTSNRSMTVSFTSSITSGTVSNTTSSIIDSSGTSSVPPVQTSKISTTASHSINVTNETVSTSFAAVLLSSSVKTRTSTYIVGLVSSSSAQRENISYIYASSEVLSKASTNSTRIGTVKIHSRSTYITLSTAGNATVTRLPAISPTISHITDSLEYTQTSATPSLTSNTSVATMLTSSSMYSQTSNYLRPSSQSREPENIMSSRSVRKETFSPFSSSVAMNSSMYTETSTYTSGLVSSSSRQPENATSSSIDTSGTSSVPLTVTSNRSMTVSFTTSITSGTVSNTTSSIIDSSGTSSVPPVWTSEISRTASFSINVTNETVTTSFAAVLMSSSVNTSTSTYIVGLVSSSSAQRENISYIYTSSDFLSKASTNSTRIGTVKIHSRSTYITLSTAGNATVTRLPAISPTISHITDSFEYTQTSATPSLTSNTSVATMLTSSSMYSQTSNYLRPSSQSREPENIMSSRSVRKETFSPFSSSVAMNSSMYLETSTYTSGLVSSSSRQPENATSSSIDTSGTSSVPLTVTSNSSMTVSFTTSITNETVSTSSASVLMSSSVNLRTSTHIVGLASSSSAQREYTTSSINDSSGTSSVPPVRTSKISTTASLSTIVTNETASTSFAAVLMNSSVNTPTSTYIAELVSSSSTERESISSFIDTSGTPTVSLTERSKSSLTVSSTNMITKKTVSPSLPSVSMESSIYAKTSSYTLRFAYSSSAQHEYTTILMDTSGIASVPSIKTSTSAMTVSFTSIVTSGAVSTSFAPAMMNSSINARISTYKKEKSIGDQLPSCPSCSDASLPTATSSASDFFPTNPSPISVPDEFRVQVLLKIPVNVDVERNDSFFKDMERRLENLYNLGANKSLSRKRRDILMFPFRRPQFNELKDQLFVEDVNTTPDAGTTNVRTKREIANEIRVKILNVTREGGTETVRVIFYVTSGGKLVEAERVSKTMNAPSQEETKEELRYPVSEPFSAIKTTKDDENKNKNDNEIIFIILSIALPSAFVLVSCVVIRCMKKRKKTRPIKLNKVAVQRPEQSNRGEEKIPQMGSVAEEAYTRVPTLPAKDYPDVVVQVPTPKSRSKERKSNSIQDKKKHVSPPPASAFENITRMNYEGLSNMTTIDEIPLRFRPAVRPVVEEGPEDTKVTDNAPDLDHIVENTGVPRLWLEKKCEVDLKSRSEEKTGSKPEEAESSAVNGSNDERSKGRDEDAKQHTDTDSDDTIQIKANIEKWRNKMRQKEKIKEQREEKRRQEQDKLIDLEKRKLSRRDWLMAQPEIQAILDGDDLRTATSPRKKGFRQKRRRRKGRLADSESENEVVDVPVREKIHRRRWPHRSKRIFPAEHDGVRLVSVRPKKPRVYAFEGPAAYDHEMKPGRPRVYPESSNVYHEYETIWPTDEQTLDDTSEGEYYDPFVPQYADPRYVREPVSSPSYITAPGQQVPHRLPLRMQETSLTTPPYSSRPMSAATSERHRVGMYYDQHIPRPSAIYSPRGRPHMSPYPDQNTSGEPPMIAEQPSHNVTDPVHVATSAGRKDGNRTTDVQSRPTTSAGVGEFREKSRMGPTQEEIWNYSISENEAKTLVARVLQRASQNNVHPP